MITAIAPTAPLATRSNIGWPQRESPTVRRHDGQQLPVNCLQGQFEWLFRERYPQLFAVARKILNSEHDAADAVQDAFVAAFTSLDRFQERSQLLTWLHRIVMNCCLMKLRTKKRRHAVSLEAVADVAATPPSDSLLPFQGFPLEQEEMRQLIHRALDRMPAGYREIIVLRDIQELDTDTTSRLLGISRAATKTRLHRARRALRMKVEQLTR